MVDQRLLGERLRDVIASVGRKSPTMGGSTASIACALIGLSMVKMSVIISAARHPERSELVAAEEQIDRLSEELAAAGDRDRQHFQRYMQALRTSSADPRHDENPTLRQAEAEATHQPLSAAELIAGSLELLISLTGSIDHLVESDLYSGAAILRSAFSGTMMAVEINLDQDRLSALKEETDEKRDALFRRADRAFDTLSRAALERGFRF